MKNKKTDPPVTRNDLLKEFQSIGNKFAEELKATQEELSKEIRATNDFCKKLHMQIVGTQNDLLKFKEDIVIQVMKSQQELRENRETMFTKEDGQKIIEHIDAFAQKSENYDRKALLHEHRIEDRQERLTHLEKSVSK